MKQLILISVAVVLLAASALAQHQIESVASDSLTNQTGNTGKLLYIPTETGVFRVTFYMQCTGAGVNGEGLYPELDYTDDNGPEYISIPPGKDGQPGPPTTWTGIIKSEAGSPITWRIEVSNGDTSIYEVYVLLERVGPSVPGNDKQ